MIRLLHFSLSLCLVFTMFAVLGNRVFADIFTAFNFEELNIGVNNSPTPSIGTGTAISLGMTNNYGGNNNVATNDVLNSAGSSTPTRAWRIRSAGAGNGNGWHQDAPQFTQGAQFTTSTLGYANIILNYDWQPTTQSIKHQQVQYSVDGSNWINFGPLQIGPGAEAWVNGIQLDFSSITAANNNPFFGVRMVSAYAPNTSQYVNLAGNPINNTSGNWRFDSITFSGTAIPEPSTAAIGLLASIGIACTRRRRDR